MKRFETSLASLLCAVLAANFSMAEEIVILDAENNIRAQAEVSSASDVEFSLTDENGDPADGFDVVLVNLETHQTLTRPVVSGTALFEDLPPGRWQVSSTVDFARFKAINILGAGAGLATGGAAGVVAPLVIAGAAAAGPAVALSDSGSDHTPLSPSS